MKPRLPRKLKKRIKNRYYIFIHYAVRFVVKAMAQANKHYAALRKPVPDFAPGGIIYTGEAGAETIITTPHTFNPTLATKRDKLLDRLYTATTSYKI
jgi:hypothetical protein